MSQLGSVITLYLKALEDKREATRRAERMFEALNDFPPKGTYCKHMKFEYVSRPWRYDSDVGYRTVAILVGDEGETVGLRYALDETLPVLHEGPWVIITLSTREMLVLAKDQQIHHEGA